VKSVSKKLEEKHKDLNDESVVRKIQKGNFRGAPEGAVHRE
jgi:hypothetical protein